MALLKINTVLEHLSDTGGLTAAKLTRKTEIPRSSMDRVLDQLLEVGWIWRRKADKAFFLTDILLSRKRNSNPIATDCVAIIDELDRVCNDERLKYSIAINTGLGRIEFIEATDGTRPLDVALPIFDNPISTAVLSTMPPDILLKNVKEALQASDDKSTKRPDFIGLQKKLTKIRKDGVFTTSSHRIIIPMQLSIEIFGAVQIFGQCADLESVVVRVKNIPNYLGII